jgi:hypothetical protein
MANESFLDELYKGLGNAITDIRQKVVEEPMWGRAVTEREPEVPQWPQAKEQAGHEEQAPEQNKDHTPDLER